MEMLQLNKVYNMDCMDGMKLLDDKSISMVLTSPPYNIIRPNSTDRGYDLYKDGMSNEEYSKWCCDIINEIDRVLEKDGCVLWNMSYGCENTEVMSITIAEILKNTNFTLSDIIVWKKQTATPNNVSANRLTRIVEYIYVLCRVEDFQTMRCNKKVIGQREDTGQTIYENVYNFITAKNNDYSTELNKATYSTELCNKLMNIYYDGGTVLDPFMGTGTTAISCIEHNATFIGFELSEKQTQHANKRIDESMAQIRWIL